MITDQIKAMAVARLKRGTPVEAVSEAFEIPLKVLNEWKNEYDINDLVVIESNIQAVEEVVNGEVLPVNEDNLKNTLELTAIDLAKQASSPGMNGDIMQAKAVQLCSDAVSKLYTTIVLKNGSGQPDGAPGTGGGLAIFTNSMKD